MFVSRNVFRRELLIGIAVAVVFGCAAFVYGLRTLESLMTFHPSRMSAAEMKSTPDGAESVWFNSADGTKLNGFYFASQSKPEVATIIFFHGNGGNITDVSWLGERFAKHGFNVLLFDYRGYGASDGISGDESGLYADGDAAVADLGDGRILYSVGVFLSKRSELLMARFAGKARVEKDDPFVLLGDFVERGEQRLAEAHFLRHG